MANSESIGIWPICKVAIITEIARRILDNTLTYLRANPDAIDWIFDNAWWMILYGLFAHWAITYDSSKKRAPSRPPAVPREY